MVVDRFSDAIVENPKLQKNLALTRWNESGKLAGLKFMLTPGSANRPFQYTGKELGEAHKDLRITSDEFDEVGAEIASALDHFGVPEREKQESVGGHRREEGRGGQSFPVSSRRASRQGLSRLAFDSCVVGDETVTHRMRHELERRPESPRGSLERATPGLVVTAPDCAPISHQASRRQRVWSGLKRCKIRSADTEPTE
jgi:hemoglobin